MPLAVPTARRLAYHKDGSQVFEYNPTTGFSYQYTSTQMKQLNSDLGSHVFGNGTFGIGNAGGSLWEIIFFPGLRDIQAARYWMQADNSNSQTMFYSTDTTGPGTGSWTVISGTNTTNNHTDTTPGVSSQYRFPIVISPIVSSVRAIMVPWTTSNNFAYIGQIHVWGKRSASDTNRQVGFCDASGNRPTQDQDFGDVGVGTTAKWKAPANFNESDQLYVKNYSAANTANSVVIGREANADDTGNLTTIVAETTFSLDDITYATTVTITSIAPSTVAGPIYVKYATLSTDPVNSEIEIATISVGSWT